MTAKAAALAYVGTEPDSVYEISCTAALEDAGGPLWRAVQDGAVDAGASLT